MKLDTAVFSFRYQSVNMFGDAGVTSQRSGVDGGTPKVPPFFMQVNGKVSPLHTMKAYRGCTDTSSPVFNHSSSW
jgi:hypothetical protein